LSINLLALLHQFVPFPLALRLRRVFSLNNLLALPPHLRDAAPLVQSFCLFFGQGFAFRRQGIPSFAYCFSLGRQLLVLRFDVFARFYDS